MLERLRTLIRSGHTLRIARPGRVDTITQLLTRLGALVARFGQRNVGIWPEGQQILFPIDLPETKAPGLGPVRHYFEIKSVTIGQFDQLGTSFGGFQLEIGKWND